MEPTIWAIPSIDAEALRNRLRIERDLAVVDVRSDVEWCEGHIPSAIHVPLSESAGRAPVDLPNRHAPLVVYCAHGVRSAEALRLLQQLGYIHVEHLKSGFIQWKALGFAVHAAEPTEVGCSSGPGIDRYARQMLLEQVGAAGQERLSNKRVLIIGLGRRIGITCGTLSGGGGGWGRWAWSIPILWICRTCIGR